MIQFRNLKLYSQVVKGVRYPRDTKRPLCIIYFSENSTFIEDYKRLNIMPMDCRTVVVPTTKIPRTRLLGDLRTQYKSLGLYSFSDMMKLPSGKNVVFDTSNYAKELEEKLKLKHYRQRGGMLLKSLLERVDEIVPPNYEKVFMYTIDTSKPFNSFLNRKFFPILKDIKSENFQYAKSMIYGVLSDIDVRYRLLMKDGSYKFPRIYQYMKMVKSLDEADKFGEEDIMAAANKILAKIKGQVASKNLQKFGAAINIFLSKDDDLVAKINSGELTANDAIDTAIASILYNGNNDISKSMNIARNIKAADKSKALIVIDKKYADELLEPQKSINSANEIFSQIIDMRKIAGGKTPEHLFAKRDVDFEKNLKKDLENSFGVLATKDVPLKIDSLVIEDVEAKSTEIAKSDISRVKVVLIDPRGKKHSMSLDIPKIDPASGTFRVSGQRKVIINQIVVCPISFPKKYDSKFQSSYSSFHIWSKRIKNPYLEVYMGGYKLPLLVVLAYSFGWKETLKKYDIKVEITDDRPAKTDISTKINNDQYIVFKNITTDLKKELAHSLINAKVSQYAIKPEFGTKEYFNNLIIKMTGRMNSTYLIGTNLENIVDPVAKQVLINQQLPFELPDIMHYMATKVIEGYVEDRNDISNQRIRNSEVLVHLTQKLILASYTDYKEQVLAGNKDAKFNLPQGKVLSEFNTSEIVSSMEYANPIEEMAVMSRITPIGKSVGGVAGSETVQTDARNVHPSHFGNIDPLDTPEGGNVGVVQQLTVDAYITSARGLFNQKEIRDAEGVGILSTSSVMVPYISNNDGNRVMFSCSQSKQALPLKNPEAPVVRSGYESLLTNVLSDSFIKRSPCNGKVVQVTSDHISIICKEGEHKEISIIPEHLKSGSGRNTLSIFNPVVKAGQSVKQRQPIAEGSCINDGIISMGRNVLTAVMPYKGYNFEDGVVINEKIVTEDKMTSIHGIEEEILVSEKDRILKMVKIGEETEKGQPLIIKTIGELEELIGYEEYDDDENIDIGGGNLVKKSPGGRVVDIEMFSNLDADMFPKYKDLINRTDRKYKKRGKQKFTFKGESVKGVLVKFTIEQELRIGLGDKIANRYGNKGIVSLVEKDENMPRTPWGERVEYIINPLGILSRMNMGQVYELYSGHIAKELHNRVVSVKDQTQIVNMMGKVLPILDRTDKKAFSTSMLKGMAAMSKAKWQKFIEETKQSGFVPILAPPFKSPTKEDLMKAMKVLKLKSGYNLFLPEFNTKTHSEVPVGYMYLYKLEHIGSLKIHARSTGPMTSKTRQPTAGKRREGGQRMGELDTYSLISYNTPNLLAEFFGPLSDDAVTKNEIIADIIQQGSAEYREPKVSPGKDLLNSYFTALLLEKRG